MERREKNSKSKTRCHLLDPRAPTTMVPPLKPVRNESLRAAEGEDYSHHSQEYGGTPN